MSEETHSLLAGRGLLLPEEWQATGGVEVKGKGVLQTYINISPPSVNHEADPNHAVHTVIQEDKLPPSPMPYHGFVGQSQVSFESLAPITTTAACMSHDARPFDTKAGMVPRLSFDYADFECSPSARRVSWETRQMSSADPGNLSPVSRRPSICFDEMATSKTLGRLMKASLMSAFGSDFVVCSTKINIFHLSAHLISARPFMFQHAPQYAKP